MPRSRASYRSTARNKARGDSGLEWVGVPTKPVRAVKWSETYQANGAREHARRAKHLACHPRLASYPNPFRLDA